MLFPISSFLKSFNFMTKLFFPEHYEKSYQEPEGRFYYFQLQIGKLEL